MRFYYTGGEALPGSGQTLVFGDHKVTAASGWIVDLPEKLTAKARNHPHFRAVIDAAPEVKAEPAPIAEPDRRAELIAEAEKHSVKIDKRWNTDRIIEALQAKLAELNKDTA